MTEPEELDEDLFADLYDADDAAAKPEALVQDIQPEPIQASAPSDTGAFTSDANPEPKDEESGSAPIKDEPMYGNGHNGDTGPSWNAGQANGGNAHQYNDAAMEQEPAPIGIKEDGKMFIGGLNWETTDQSLKEYFSTFGEVQECTVMRDGASGRSRGFGFLTFKDPKTVNVVMVKEHYLDGKIIDPKRAIPRDEQERTSKIFVGGVSQDANEHVFKDYFAQFGRVVDATLMMDKDTGRPRGFGFVTFDSEAAVDATLAGDLQILGKPIEVKKAQPRGNMREEEEPPGRRGGRGGGRGGKDFRDNDRGFDNNSNQNQGTQNQQGGQSMMGGMTPQMMAQYWQKMQQYFTTMQQQMASAAVMQNGGMGGMGAMNPAMMQQMQQMQQMKALQQMQQAQMGRQQGSQSPLPQSPGAQGGMQGMNPAMLQQMQQMQQMQMQQAQLQAQQGGEEEEEEEEEATSTEAVVLWALVLALALAPEEEDLDVAHQATTRKTNSPSSSRSTNSSKRAAPHRKRSRCNHTSKVALRLGRVCTMMSRSRVEEVVGVEVGVGTEAVQDRRPEPRVRLRMHRRAQRMRASPGRTIGVAMEGGGDTGGSILTIGMAERVALWAGVLIGRPPS
ncbi:hypothetical protein HO173_002789 [Letharia columbiana]|uniref:RRM domain-containing protein n=1 Tax=Letharia columbiana TaxID=112416 RepID=A0A8H6G1S1_9LECA|nr:uncharacterized protein HO173_002789 [Letharia columbiana]KAF6238917.1 hypothetical protein HO173_002789 [Letharia columbiana]